MTFNKHSIINVEHRQHSANNNIMRKDQIIEKWIILSLNRYSIQSIRAFADQSIDGWQLLIIDNHNTKPSDWNMPIDIIDYIYLSFDKQKSLNYNILHLIEKYNYSRTIIAHLYAIENGARWIYDVDDDMEPIDKGIRQFDILDDGSSIYGLVFALKSNMSDNRKFCICTKINTNFDYFSDFQFNPYEHFGQRGITQFDFSAQPKKKRRRLQGYQLCKSLKMPIIQYAMISKSIETTNQDVDSLSKLTEFDIHAPTIFVESQVISTIDIQLNTLYHYDAFWSLFLPKNINDYRLYNSYFTQIILHLTNNLIGYYPTNVRRILGIDEFVSKDFTDYDQIFKFMLQFNCNREHMLQKCLLDLGQQFVNQNLWVDIDFQLFQLAIGELNRLKYRYIKFNSSLSTRIDIENRFHNGTAQNCRLAYYYAQNLVDTERDTVAKYHIQRLEEWCNENVSIEARRFDFSAKSRHFKPIAETATSIARTALIITYNNRLGPSVRILQRMYRAHFGHVIFCGRFDPIERALDFITYDVTFPNLQPFSYIHVNTTIIAVGERAYYCGAKVFEMRLQAIDAYVVMSDDTVFNYFRPVNLHRVQVGQAQPGFWWWNKANMGGKQVLDALALIRTRIEHPRWHRLALAWNEYSQAVGRDGYAVAGEPGICSVADWFSVPADKLWIYYELAEVFEETGVYHELVVPRIAAGIGWLEMFRSQQTVNPDVNHAILRFERDRKQWTKIYNANITYMHPIKLSYTGYNLTKRYEFCTIVLKTMHAETFE